MLQRLGVCVLTPEFVRVYARSAVSLLLQSCGATTTEAVKGKWSRCPRPESLEVTGCLASSG